jgi:hypothetical protein
VLLTTHTTIIIPSTEEETTALPHTLSSLPTSAIKSFEAIKNLCERSQAKIKNSHALALLNVPKFEFKLTQSSSRRELFCFVKFSEAQTRKTFPLVAMKTRRRPRMRICTWSFDKNL